ncbi:hypothetical protein HDU91_004566, partial [Kappamyces sp. JEL0680]
ALKNSSQADEPDVPGGSQETSQEPASVPPESQALDTTDLMDEQHLSIMDTSMVNDEDSFALSPASRPPILDIDDFLAATGIKFDDYSTPLDEIEIMQTGSAIQAAISALERENLTQGCAELENIVQALQAETADAKNAINASPPLLFDEFSQGTAKERDEIVEQLQLTKNIAYQGARVEWYNWKGLTLDHLKGNLVQDYAMLQSHREAIAPMLEEFRRLNSGAREYFEGLDKMVPLAKKE